MEITLNIPDELANDFDSIPDDERNQDVETFVAKMIKNHRVKIEKQEVEIENLRVQVEHQRQHELKRKVVLANLSPYMKKNQSALSKMYLHSVNENRPYGN